MTKLKKKKLLAMGVAAATLLPAITLIALAEEDLEKVPISENQDNYSVIDSEQINLQLEAIKSEPSIFEKNIDEPISENETINHEVNPVVYKESENEDFELNYSTSCNGINEVNEDKNLFEFILNYS